MIHILTLNWNGLSKLQVLKPSFKKALIWQIRYNGSKDVFGIQ